MVLKILKDWLGGTNKLERFWLLAKIEFKLRYYENSLGLLWALIKPISDIVIYYIAFEVLMKQGVPQFISYLFIGLIMWGFFLECTTGTIAILVTKKYLYEYTNMNKIEIYLSVIGSNVIGLAFNFTMFIFFYLLFENGQTYLTWHDFLIIPIVFNLVLLSLAFSLILSSIYVFAKDIQQIWMIIAGLAFWMSPILFKLEIFRDKLPGFDFINPFAGIVINMRNVIMYHDIPEWDLFLWDFVYSGFFLLLGLFFLNKFGSKAAEKL